MSFDTRPVGLLTCVGAALAVCLAAPVMPSAAVASTFAYQSQTGHVEAAGGAPATGSSSESVPFSGLADIDEQALVQDSAGPDAYIASASIQTSLDANQIDLSGATHAEVGSCDPAFPPFPDPCFAYAEADVTILFDLADPETLHLRLGPWTGNNGPHVALTHLDLGFVLEITFTGGGDDFSIECGTLSEPECLELFGAVFGGVGTAPAGSYQLDFDLFAFDDGSASCAVGCGSAGGSATLEVVPPEIAVDVDVKPGSETNPVNLFSRVLIPVAILGSEVLDVADVDVATLRFEGAAPVHAEAGHLEDVDDDAFTDLLSHYAAPDTTIAFGQTEACVTGELLDGTPFKGCDAIVTVPPCGIGFELALLLPPLMWLHRRRGARFCRVMR